MYVAILTTCTQRSRLLFVATVRSWCWCSAKKSPQRTILRTTNSFVSTFSFLKTKSGSRSRVGASVLFLRRLRRGKWKTCYTESKNTQTLVDRMIPAWETMLKLMLIVGETDTARDRIGAERRSVNCELAFNSLTIYTSGYG